MGWPMNYCPKHMDLSGVILCFDLTRENLCEQFSVNGIGVNYERESERELFELPINLSKLFDSLPNRIIKLLNRSSYIIIPEFSRKVDLIKEILPDRLRSKHISTPLFYRYIKNYYIGEGIFMSQANAAEKLFVLARYITENIFNPLELTILLEAKGEII